MKEIQYTTILFFVLILFVFLIVYYFNNEFSHNETFAQMDLHESIYTNPHYIVNTTPLNMSHTTLMDFQGKWHVNKESNWESSLLKHNASGQNITWDQISFSNTSKIENKNTDFSISFWIYINEPGKEWQPIFRVFDQGYSERVPGIWLRCCNTSSLHIRQTVEKQENGMPSWTKYNSGIFNDEIRKLSIDQLRPEFCVIVFSGKSYQFYKNGELQYQHSHSSNPEPIRGDKTLIQIGRQRVNDENVYALKDVELYNNALSADTVAALYERIKHDGDVQSACAFFGKSCTSSGGCESFTDGIQSLLPWTKRSQYEGFESSIGLPEQAKLANGQFFSFSDYKKIKPDSSNDQMSSYSTLSGNEPYVVLDKTEYNFSENKALKYVKFNSRNKEYMKIPEQIIFGNKGCSFGFWFSAHNRNLKYSRIFDFGNVSSNRNKNNIIVLFKNKHIGLRLWRNGEKIGEDNVFNDAANEKWYHFVWTLSPNGSWDIYINGAHFKNFPNKGIPSEYIGENTPGGVSFSQYYGFGGGQDKIVTNGDETVKLNDLKDNTNVGHSMSSINVTGKTKATLYDQPNQQGSSKTLQGPYSNNAMGFMGWNDRTKSMTIEGPPQEKVVRENQYIGRSNWVNDDYYQGIIADFRIFDSVLTSEQVQTLYSDLPSADSMSTMNNM